MRIYRTFGLAALLMLSFTPARATTVYTTQASLEGSTPLLSYTHPDLTSFIGSFFSSITDPVTGVVFSTSGNQMFVTDAQTIHLTTGSGTTMTITIPNTVLAFGTDTQGHITFTGDGTTTDIPTASFPNTNFFGARLLNAPITAFTYVPNVGNFDAGGFEVGVAAAGSSAPEAATLVSIGSGLLLLGMARKRLKWMRPAI